MAQHELRPYRTSDLPRLLQLYQHAVQSQCPAYYSAEQVRAWAQHPWHSDGVANAINAGFTLVNPVEAGSPALAAFAVLEPSDRLSLLYCDGRWSRQGRSSSLLAALEA
ncbi:MAG: GNAT family N-acetyltransferase, partial [Cyanobacteria bacterium K_DeepCast_35m_m2_023]|nr:GNAT family N-acetyltransferase [Cyanobacteria bacterium K_DeepCast_35m_m2_023]